MPKPLLFDEDSEEEVEIKTENAYAKRYDTWREKEELHKLEQKYGSKPLNDDGTVSSDSEDESDEHPEVSEEVEKQFLKTLALLKTKDPRIYDPSYKFFDEKIEKEKEKEPETKRLTFGDSDDDEDDDPNIFSIEKKAEIDSDDGSKNCKGNSENEKIKEFLIGKVDHVDDEVEKDLAPLRALWSDPKLNDGEAFLRDYILNKRYLDDGDAGEAADKIRDDDDLEEDEKMVEEQGKFERAYNFRFEEPDEEYLKRFPRTMNYIRPKDDRRSRKRAEIRERKEEEKKRKMEEIARLKALKLKEIQEKIAKIKEVTGNQDLAFKDEDIEGDFDPEEHDKRMKALFDEEYYGEADDQKPVFPDLDEELEIENWENFEPEYNEDNENADEPHCEDTDFNMDADYDPKKAKENLIEELKRNMGKKRRNRKRKSKLAELLSDEKPKFIPDVDKTYAEYMQEYYQMDCEDVIGGDLPTRFKYREVVPNDFGLTVEEILLADDKELTQWVPLKKIVKYRPEHVEKGEVKVYSQKAADIRLKKKILPSLFKDLPEEPELVVPTEVSKKKKKKKKKQTNQENNDETNDLEENNDNSSNAESEKQRERKKKSVIAENNEESNGLDQTNESNVQDNSTETSKKKKKHKHSEHKESVNHDVPQNIDNESENLTKKHKKIKVQNKNQESTTKCEEITTNTNEIEKQKDGKKKLNSEDIYANENICITKSSNLETSKKKKKKHKQTENVTNVDNINANQDPTKESKPLKTEHKGNNKNVNDVPSISKQEITTTTKENEKQKEGNNKKKKPKNAFNVETINVKTNPSSGTNYVNNQTNGKINKNNLKRKSNSTTEENIPKKKSKKNKNFKKVKPLKNSGQSDKPANPLSKLSDERLKAYGLNPKKYRSFLKYKKF
ncbi:protein KRI1 homolog [Vanessa cardui]|uniref:protein KRI1 homolog n=1 Tax=Vanessa cardui TaxID=171605 RepID=UPI001F14340B|nr:protein KRI1 homolog [Vanessa cardui]